MSQPSEAEALAQKMADEISAAAQRPPRAHDIAALQALGRDLITALRKDAELRKWAVEKSIDGKLGIEQAKNIYDFVREEKELVIKKIESTQIDLAEKNL